MLSSARLGDKHVCPLPGHGTTPIASASADTNINFMGAARVGDTCGCGAVITTGFPSILINGRPMAHLSSPTSHGGTIITGSGDTFGGFVLGSAVGSPVIDFALMGAIRPDGKVDEERMATLLADPQLKTKATAVGALVDPNAPKKPPAKKAKPEEEKKPAACTHPDNMEPVAAYIADEMNRNILHPSVVKMKNANSFDPAAETRKYRELPWYARIGEPPNYYTMALGKKAAALTLWTERVGQNRPWDHKPIIKKRFGSYYYKHGKYDYFYDIWSNIHYGYVGRAGGLSESLLLDGAGLEQIASDSIRKAQDWKNKPGPRQSPGVEGLRAWDDVADRVSISIGVKLYKRYPHGGITAKIVMDEVLAVAPENWGDGVSVHECK